ncbi:hypothetical protein [Paenibacillus doosanensis]|uniref:hypothetical protein n=1 Tax=Paenibacillus doosanensis TaxID=1229154 RepID=UPI00217F5E53|nr:hypothetical protein [Paenibacillus doosanensis]
METLADVSASGIVSRPSGELPGPVGSLCRLHGDVHELTFRAAMEGSRELLAANRPWLPRFWTS